MQAFCEEQEPTCLEDERRKPGLLEERAHLDDARMAEPHADRRLAREGVARVRVTRLDTTAAAIPSPAEQWSGRARVPRRYYINSRNHRYRRGVYSGRIIRDPVGTWLLELVRW